jgi:hypothetical protein
VKREKWALQFGTAAASALVSGSRAVFEDGVSTPMRMGRDISGLLRVGDRHIFSDPPASIMTRNAKLSTSVLTISSTDLMSTKMSTLQNRSRRRCGPALAKPLKDQAAGKPAAPIRSR